MIRLPLPFALPTPQPPPRLAPVHRRVWWERFCPQSLVRGPSVAVVVWREGSSERRRQDDAACADEAVVRDADAEGDAGARGEDIVVPDRGGFDACEDGRVAFTVSAGVRCHGTGTGRETDGTQLGTNCCSQSASVPSSCIRARVSVSSAPSGTRCRTAREGVRSGAHLLTITTFSSMMQLSPITIGADIARSVQRGWITHPGASERASRDEVRVSSSERAPAADRRGREGTGVPEPIVMFPRKSASCEMTHLDPIEKELMLGESGGGGQATSEMGFGDGEGGGLASRSSG